MTSGLHSNEFGFYEGECQGCDLFTHVDDVGLCEECAAKLDRDLVRKRDWAYSWMAYGVPPEKREELRKKIIKQYGMDLELIVQDEVKKPKSKPKKKREREQR